MVKKKLASKNKKLARKTASRKLKKKHDANIAKKSWRDAYKMLILVRDGHYSSAIARMMKLPRTTCDHRIRRLEATGFVRLDVKSAANFYKLTKKGYEFIKDYRCQLSRYRGEQGKNRMHRLNVKFKILRDNEKAVFGSEHEMNNWIQKYTRLTFPIGITLQKNPDTIVVMFHEFESDKRRTFTDFFNHVMRGTYYVYNMLREKYGIIIDVASAETTDQHLANERPDLDGKLDNKKRTALGLNRKASSYFPFKKPARSWLDYSKGMPEIETNDLLYEERLLMMPETIQAINDKFTPALERLTAQIELHLQATLEWKETAREIRDLIKKGMKK